MYLYIINLCILRSWFLFNLNILQCYEYYWKKDSNKKPTIVINNALQIIIEEEVRAVKERRSEINNSTPKEGQNMEMIYRKCTGGYYLYVLYIFSSIFGDILFVLSGRGYKYHIFPSKQRWVIESFSTARNSTERTWKKLKNAEMKKKNEKLARRRAKSGRLNLNKFEYGSVMCIFFHATRANFFLFVRAFFSFRKPFVFRKCTKACSSSVASRLFKLIFY